VKASEKPQSNEAVAGRWGNCGHWRRRSSWIGLKGWPVVGHMQGPARRHSEVSRGAGC
jgi:hypothetical protein